MGEMRNSYNITLQEPEEKYSLEDPSVNLRTLLKYLMSGCELYSSDDVLLGFDTM
jgi:hypothetical protein